jgi:hypothetical protein
VAGALRECTFGTAVIWHVADVGSFGERPFCTTRVDSRQQTQALTTPDARERGRLYSGLISGRHTLR